MTPDEELERLSRSCIDPSDQFSKKKHRRALERAERPTPIEPCFVLKNEVEAHDRIVPCFSLNRGEFVSLTLMGNSLNTSFIPSLEKNRDWTEGSWISLIPQPRGFFGRFEKRSTWMSRIFGFSKRRARKYLARAGVADRNYEIPNDRLASRMLFLDLAHQHKFDLIIPHLMGLDPIMVQPYNERMKHYQSNHAWIVGWIGNPLITRSLLLEHSSMIPAGA